MTAAKTPPLHVLRGILRRLKVKTMDGELLHPRSTTSATRSYVLNQYRANQSISCNEQIVKLRKLAYEYYTLQQDLAERARLHALDTGAEVKLTPKEMSRRAAARAGLQLPDLNQDLP